MNWTLIAITPDSARQFFHLWELSAYALLPLSETDVTRAHVKRYLELIDSGWLSVRGVFR